MSDLISREALIKVVEADINRCYALRIDGVGALSHFIDQIKEQPTVEAVPVVHGEWVLDKRKDRIYCNHCNNYTLYEWNETAYEVSELISNFCPNCGADMRKKVEHGEID